MYDSKKVKTKYILVKTRSVRKTSTGDSKNLRIKLHLVDHHCTEGVPYSAKLKQEPEGDEDEGQQQFQEQRSAGLPPRVPLNRKVSNNM